MRKSISTFFHWLASLFHKEPAVSPPLAPPVDNRFVAPGASLFPTAQPGPQSPTPPPLPGVFGAAALSLTGGRGGNEDPNAPKGSGFDATQLISDSFSLLPDGTKYRTPPGVKKFSFWAESNQTYLFETGDGNAPVFVSIQSASGVELNAASNGNGLTQVTFKAPYTGYFIVVADFRGTSNIAGIRARKVAATPDTSNLVGR